MDLQRNREQQLAAQARMRELAEHEKIEEASRLKNKTRKMRNEATAVALGERGQSATPCVLMPLSVHINVS